MLQKLIDDIDDLERELRHIQVGSSDNKIFVKFQCFICPMVLISFGLSLGRR